MGSRVRPHRRTGIPSRTHLQYTTADTVKTTHAFFNGEFSPRTDTKGAITSKIKHAIKHKTSPTRLAQLLQPH